MKIALQTLPCSVDNGSVMVSSGHGTRGPLLSLAPFGGSSWGGLGRGTLLCDEGPCSSGDHGLGKVSGLLMPTLLLGASEVLAALLLASSAQGCAKSALWPETGKR